MGPSPLERIAETGCADEVRSNIAPSTSLIVPRETRTAQGAQRSRFARMKQGARRGQP